MAIIFTAGIYSFSHAVHKSESGTQIIRILREERFTPEKKSNAILELSGTVSEIDDSVYRFRIGKHIMCSLSERNKCQVADIKMGQTVFVRGIWNGEDYLLTECEVLPANKR